eukprot:gnl/Ergobibamus_cyprinoides/4278.p1 GENE.gnl/Ergobibamus_cyprinoides/4278~~gnl/Ergobibamus_cyprinoides/4278.p1  ORF type:complete len:127 (+),score=9.48 gnl/Ergobibamus_cyprinoides/4278:65-445(+)
MVERVRRCIAEQVEVNGVVIEKAVYGVVSPCGTVEDPNLVVDVTDAVQVLVHRVAVPGTRGHYRSELLINGGHSKAELEGFFDPAPGEAKHLFVRYQFRGSSHEFHVDDTARVSAPAAHHCVPVEF